MNWLQIIEAVGLVVFIGVGIFAGGWFKILKETNQLLKDQNSELKADNKQWQGKHEENVKAISKMQGQIDVLQNIPLGDIKTHMIRQTEINEKLLSFMENKMALA